MKAAEGYGRFKKNGEKGFFNQGSIRPNQA
jgi:hypothetical protein